MTTRDISRSVRAALAAFADRNPAGVRTGPGSASFPPARAAAAASSTPAIGALSPDAGSTGGSTPLKITGAGFQPGATVMVDGIAISAFVLDSHTIYACTPPHDSGPVDVVIVNPDSSSAVLGCGYNYVSPRAFDFNGDWIGVAGSEHQMELRFSVRDNVLVSVSCGAGTVTFSPSPEVRHGEFSIVRSDGIGISARIVSASEAVGTINIEPCPYTNWIATRTVRADRGVSARISLVERP